MSKKIVVSSCLIGKKCAYDGKSRDNDTVKELCACFGYLDICPEMEGGLGCPREIHENAGGTGEDVLDGKARVLSFSGKDHTKSFVRGAKRALGKALQSDISVAVLKSRSPSCGKGEIYSGRFDGTLRKGNGVTTALFLRNSICVFTEKEIKEVRKILTGHISLKKENY